MKKFFLILAFLAMAVPLAIGADDPPDVTLTIKARIDSWGGGEYGAQYLISCAEDDGGNCTITDEQTLYLPKIGPIVYVRWCNSWGQCNETALKMEMD